MHMWCMYVLYNKLGWIPESAGSQENWSFVNAVILCDTSYVLIV